MSRARIDLPMDDIAAFCRRWQIVELSLFGSVLRDDFRPDSDIDLLVTFAPDERWGFGDLSAMRRELREILGREVDLLERRAVERARNPYLRHSVLMAAEPIYDGRHEARVGHDRRGTAGASLH